MTTPATDRRDVRVKFAADHELRTADAVRLRDIATAARRACRAAFKMTADPEQLWSGAEKREALARRQATRAQAALAGALPDADELARWRRDLEAALALVEGGLRDIRRGRLLSSWFGKSREAFYPFRRTLMNRRALETDSEVADRLGEPSLVCRTSRKTLFWSFALASVPCGLGGVLLVVVAYMLLADGGKDILGCLVFLAVGALFLWGGWVLWKKANRLRHVLVAVHTGGLSYRDGGTCWACRWDEIEDVQCRVFQHYEESTLAVGGVVPIPGTTTRNYSHTTQQVKVRRKDGSQMVFTDELRNIGELAQAIRDGASRNNNFR
jgi:hypothetical protein